MLNLVVKVQGKTPLEAKLLEEAMISVLRAGKRAFSESDFLGRRQEDYLGGNYPGSDWSPSEEPEEERRNFKKSLQIFHTGPEDHYCPVSDKKLKIVHPPKPTK